MKKLLILKINLPSLFVNSISTFVESALGKTDKDTGINQLNYDDKSLSAVFYKKIIVNAKSYNPFGDSSPVVYELYQSQEFYLLNIKNNNYLVLIDPVKKLSYFYDFIHHIFADGFSISHKEINLGEVCRKLEDKEGFKVVKAKFLDVSINNARAVVELLSNNNALIDFSFKFGDAYNKLSRVKVKFIIENELLEFELSNTGSVHLINSNFFNNNIDKLIDLIYG